MDNESKPFSVLGLDMFGNPIEPDGAAPLAKRFIFPPFSVLNAREGAWQERKRAWLALGIQSEIGRGNSRPHHEGKDMRPGTTETGYGGGRLLESAQGDCAVTGLTDVRR